MAGTHVVVRGEECAFETAHADHETDAGHAVDWRIESLAAGVTRAGADAGVCGVPGSVNSDSPLGRDDGVDDAPPESGGDDAPKS
ncbi:MAG: hypothetical protein A07HR67_01331 [uncultured archaeon A07HR67]|jgi:hypothetical protein|nr:MAG: hypothetical protein A07HR67_01331 [uncultured archaeon A07HR67]